MRSLDLRGGAGTWRRLAIGGVAALAASVATWLAPTATQDAVADGETRTLHLYHTHSQETIDATFRVDGHYDPNVLRQLNHFLRDWRNDDEIAMDPRLFDAIWEAYRTAGATDRIQIYSAYRSPETNAMLRRRSKAVAEHSQHMLGKAMDTTMPGFPMSRIREAGMKLQNGGVGWYPSANFVHLDVGGVRSWPRMSYDQLAELFPDGKTVHIASNGQTLPGYEQARLELAQRGQTDLPPAADSGGFFAWLFGGGGGGGTAREDEEDRRAPTVVASAAPPPPAVVQRAAAEQPEPVAQAAPAPMPQPAPPQEQIAFQPQPPGAPGALAYAPPAAAAQAPIDGQTPIAGQAGLAGQPVAVVPAEGTAPQQVASLEPAAAPPAATDTEDAVMPLPPRRPAELVAETPDVPLPPARPVAMQSVASRADDAPEAAPPGRRHAALPGLVAGDARPREALAFAAVETPDAAAAAPDLRPASREGIAAVDLRAAAKPLALRASRNRTVVAASAEPAAAETPPAVVAPAQAGLTGLRRAARRLAEKAAL